MKRTALFFSVLLLFTIQNPGFTQKVDLTVNQAQSSVLITVLTGDDTSSISGTGSIVLSPASEPFQSAQLTELDLSLADGFSIGLLGGLITVSVEPDGATLFVITAGAAGMVDASNQFDQLGNVVGVAGESEIIDDSPGDLFGGDMIIDLSTVKPIDFDATDIQLSVDGQMLTVSLDIVFEFDFLDGLATLTVDGTIVLNGTLPDPFVAGDVNCDGVVDLLDVSPFVQLLSTGGFSEKADINGDGTVDLLDVSPFVALLSG